MKKKLLTIGVLSMSICLSAQSLLSVGDKALMTVRPETLVYNAGSLRTKGSGVLDIYGNVIVKANTGTDVLQTTDASGSVPKTNGGNIILRLNAADNSRYGQLAIIGLNDTSITGIVDKEFRDNSHGSYQQLAMPFNGKQIGSLSTELYKTFTDVRRSMNEVLIYNNRAVRSDAALIATSTSTSSSTGYYMVGSQGSKVINYTNNTNTEINPNKANNAQVPVYTTGAYIVRGVPFDDNNKTMTLTDAGKDIDFGGGNNINFYREYYNSYVQDRWDVGIKAWTNANYGRNMYQFGNPFLTNLDLKYIGINEGANGDGNYLTTIQGVRIDPGTVTTLEGGTTYANGGKFITYGAGFPTGDVDVVIKPMQTFVVKLTGNTATGANATLNFNTLRRFEYTQRKDAVYSGPTSAKFNSNSTVKQLGVIALDADGKEMGRCYYVVYPDGKTGKLDNGAVSTQVTNTTQNVIGTFEEDPIKGGYDSSVTANYWLYINEANEFDFKGKSIPMNLYHNAIKSLKFEIRENAELIEDGQQVLSTGKEFYYKVGDNEAVAIKNGGIVSVTGTSYGLFYDKPEAFLSSTNNLKPSRTKVVYNNNIDDYVVLFDPDWKQADIKVYDASGKLILSKDKVSAKTDYILSLQKTNGVYVVVATSETGDVINTKIIR